MRDPANAALVNSDPELQQWVRNVKMTAEDVKSKMRNTAAPIFAAQVKADRAKHRLCSVLQGTLRMGSVAVLCHVDRTCVAYMASLGVWCCVSSCSMLL